MKKVLFISLLLVANFVVAQNYSQNVLEKLYIKAIQNRFDLMLQNETFYFEPSDMIDKIDSEVRVPNFKFLSRKKLEKKAFIENGSLNLIRIGYEQNSKDTIDVYFASVRLFVKKNGNLIDANYKLVPDKANVFIRLVYIENQDWKIIYNGFMKN